MFHVNHRSIGLLASFVLMAFLTAYLDIRLPDPTQRKAIIPNTTKDKLLQQETLGTKSFIQPRSPIPF